MITEIFSVTGIHEPNIPLDILRAGKTVANFDELIVDSELLRIRDLEAQQCPEKCPFLDKIGNSFYFCHQKADILRRKAGYKLKAK